MGLEVKAKGLMIQPKKARTYQYLEKELRALFFIKPQQDIWFFDLTYSPWDYKMQLATFVLSPLIALLVLLGIRRAKKRQQMEQEITFASEVDYQNFNADVEDIQSADLQQWPQDKD